MTIRECDFEWACRFTRPKRGYPWRRILDGFGADFFIVFDYEDCPEFPNTIGKCDIQIVPLQSDDYLADAITVVSDADRYGVLRFLAALGISRFDDRVKSAYYELSNPLRDQQ